MCMLGECVRIARVRAYCTRACVYVCLRACVSECVPVCACVRTCACEPGCQSSRDSGVKHADFGCFSCF